MFRESWGECGDLLMNGWKRVEDDEDAQGGPVVFGGDVLAHWIKGDLASDFIRLVGFLCGESIKEIVSSLSLRGMIIEADIHVHGRRGRQGAIWLTVNYEDGSFDGVYFKDEIYVSSDLKEMIEVAAIGNEGEDENPECPF
jgi:hypothetical protein